MACKSQARRAAPSLRSAGRLRDVRCFQMPPRGCSAWRPSGYALQSTVSQTGVYFTWYAGSCPCCSAESVEQMETQHATPFRAASCLFWLDGGGLVGAGVLHYYLGVSTQCCHSELWTSCGCLLESLSHHQFQSHTCTAILDRGGWRDRCAVDMCSRGWPALGLHLRRILSVRVLALLSKGHCWAAGSGESAEALGG